MSPDFLSPQKNNSIFLVSSDEPLFIRDYLDATRKAFRSAGFEDIQTLYVEQGFDWAEQSSSSTMSLFSLQTLKIYQFYSSKPGVAGAKGITELCEKTNPDEVVLLVMPKLDSKTKNSAWCKKVKQAGALIELKPVYANQLTAWISQRAQQKTLNLSPDAARFLADRTEGNLLAADQELEKLMLLFPASDQLSLENVATSAAHQARFSQYDLADCCLSGDHKRALKILNNQRAEGVASLTLLNVLKSSLDIVSRVKHVVNDAQKLAKLWLQLRVWDSKKRMYLQAANRLSVQHINDLIQQCAMIDRIEKGQQTNHPSYVKLKPKSADEQGLELLELVNNFSGLKI